MYQHNQGLKVLLVVAEQQARETVAAQLKDCAYDVTAFGSIEQACGCVAISSYDTVLAEAEDIRQRQGDAEQLVKSKGGVPLILMSESEAPGDVLQGIKLGAVDFLKRPLSPLKLRNIWQHAVRRMMGDVSIAERAGKEGEVSTVPCSTPLEPTEGVPTDASGSVSSGSSSGEPVGRAFDGDTRSGQQMASETRRPRIAVRENGGAASQQPSLAMKPPVFNAPPLMGIPPGCVPPAGPSGMAIGMPVLNQPPFAPPCPNPMNLVPPLSPTGVPCVPGTIPFPGYPMVPSPVGVSPQAPFGNVPGVAGGAAGERAAGNSAVSSPAGSEQNGGINCGVKCTESQAPNSEGEPMVTDVAEQPEQAPLGLSLKKSPSLINLISKNLCSLDNPV